MHKILNVAMLFWLAACSGPQGPGEASYQPPVQREYHEARTGAFQEELSNPVMEIRRLHYELEVPQLDEAQQLLINTLKGWGGVVVNSHTYAGPHQQRSGMLQLKLPVQHIDSLERWLQQQNWQVLSQNRQTEDIGARFADNARRLETKKALESRYLELLNQAKNMTDVLAIEEKLLQIRSEIEWMEGDEQQMKQQVVMAEVVVQWHEKLSASAQFSRSIGSDLAMGWQNLLKFLLFLLRLWPFVLLALAIWGWRKYRGKSKPA